VHQTAVLGGNRVDVYFDGGSAFDAMERDVDAARTEILVESYIWKDDTTGRRALDALGRATARGVAVRAPIRSAPRGGLDRAKARDPSVVFVIPRSEATRPDPLL